MLDSQQQRARILILALGIGLLLALRPFLSGLMGAAVFYVLCAPAHGWLTRRRVPPSASAALLTLGLALAILGPIVGVGTAAASEAPRAVAALRDSRVWERVAALHLGRVSVGPELQQISAAVVSWASGQLLPLFGGVTRAVVNFAIALFGLYFLLLSAAELWAVVRRLVPFSELHADQLRLQFHRVTESMLLGTVLTATLQGVLVGLGFAVTGLAGATFWGVVTGFASILPLFGSALVWVPGVIVHLVGGHWGLALVLAGIGGVVAANIDNVIRPLVYRRVSNLHPMATLVGAFAGVSAFGLMGLLLGPLAIEYFFALLRIYQAEYAPAETAPVETAPPAPVVPRVFP